jgi:hypothetical protein
MPGILLSIFLCEGFSSAQDSWPNLQFINEKMVSQKGKVACCVFLSWHVAQLGHSGSLAPGSQLLTTLPHIVPLQRHSVYGAGQCTQP